MKEIIKVLLQEGIDESMINKILNLIEEEYEVVSEVSKELADEVSHKRYMNKRKAKEKFLKTRDSKAEEELEKAILKQFKNDELRDKWDVSKGYKKGKDGEFHKKC